MKIVTRSCLIAALLLCGITQSFAQAPTTLSFPDKISLGKTPVNLTVYKTISISNTTENSLTLMNGGFWNDVNGYSLILPQSGELSDITLAAHETRECLTATILDMNGEFNISSPMFVLAKERNPYDEEFPDSILENFTMNVEGEAFGEPVPGDFINPVFTIFSDQTTGFSLYIDDYCDRHTVSYVNTTSAPIHINRVWLWSGGNFKITSTSPEITSETFLKPGETLKVEVLKTGNGDSDLQDWYDELLIETGENALPLASYNLSSGHANDAATSVEPFKSKNDLNFSLYPNPTNGAVLLSAPDMKNISFTITDILGNIIAAHSGDNSWLWNGNANNGGKVSAGVYMGFVRGEDNNNTVQKALQIIVLDK